MEFFAGIGAGWMNLASLALGLLAWMLPVAAMIRTAARPRASTLNTSVRVSSWRGSGALVAEAVSISMRPALSVRNTLRHCGRRPVPWPVLANPASLAR